MVCPMRFVLVGLSLLVAAISTLISWMRPGGGRDDDDWSDGDEKAEVSAWRRARRWRDASP